MSGDSLLRGPRLRSPVFGDVTWEPGEWMRAVCPHDEATRRGRPSHTDLGLRIPVESCSCGIYAARNRPHLNHLGYGHYSTEAEFRALGQVELAGKVIPGTQGWRAEMARPVALWIPNYRWRDLRQLAATYNIPVKLTNTLRS